MFYAVRSGGGQGRSPFPGGSLYSLTKRRKTTNISRMPRAAWSSCCGKNVRRDSGFTIVELVIVIAVILTIAALAVPNMVAALDDARVARAVGDIHAIEDGITLYLVINGAYPDSLDQVGYGDLLDPWHNPYQYLNHATMKGNGHARKDRFLNPLNSDYDLYSMGKDGQSVPAITASKSHDDVIRALDGSYVGLASQF